MPAIPPLRRSTSPVWRPARISRPSIRRRSRSANAQRTARAGPSKRCEQPVTREVGDRSAEARDLRPQPARRAFRAAPATARRPLDRPWRGVDDVREQDSGEDPVGGVSRAGAGEELLDLVDHDVDVADCQPVVGARYGDEASRPRCGPRHIALVDGDDRVVSAMDDKRGHPDHRQDIPNVELEEHAHDSRSRCRACGEAKEASPGLYCRGIAGEARVDRSDEVAATPRLLDHRDEALLHFRRCADLVSRRRRGACGRVQQDECARPLGIRRGEEPAIGEASPAPDDRGPLEADGVHHRGHVVHPVPERGELLGPDRIGQADPVLVERDQPAERR